jgi:hypothetical protein
MANIPANYPHGSSDEQILQALSELANDVVQSGANINTVLRLGPLISVGQTELQTRQAKRLAEQLHGAVETFRTSSDKASRTLIDLTRTLVVLTVVLVGLTIVLLVQG